MAAAAVIDRSNRNLSRIRSQKKTSVQPRTSCFNKQSAETIVKQLELLKASAVRAQAERDWDRYQEVLSGGVFVAIGFGRGLRGEEIMLLGTCGVLANFHHKQPHIVVALAGRFKGESISSLSVTRYVRPRLCYGIHGTVRCGRNQLASFTHSLTSYYIVSLLLLLPHNSNPNHENT